MAVHGALGIPENVKRDVPELDELLRKKGVKIFHQNIRGLLSKVSQIEAFLSDFPKIDILALSETHLDKLLEDTDACSIEDYELKKSRSDGNHGSVAVYISERIKYRRRKDLEHDSLECIWIEISEENVQPYLFGCIYRPPDSSEYLPPDFNEIFQSNITRFINKYQEIILVGDFNINYLNSNDHKDLKRF